MGNVHFFYVSRPKSIIFTIVSSESSASVVSAEHCSTTSTTWSVTSVAAARGPAPMFIF